MNAKQYPFGLSSRKAIMAKAKALVAHLDLELDVDHPRRDWTAATFDALRSFFSTEFGIKDFPSKLKANNRRKRNEFIWDFIAYRQKEGIYLAVESEWDRKNVPDLNHDFEKLLYVHAPIKLMICKTDTRDEGKDIAKSLSKFASDTFQHFDPGSVLLVYCRTSKKKGERNISFIWQNPGSPTRMAPDPLILREL